MDYTPSPPPAAAVDYAPADAWRPVWVPPPDPFPAGGYWGTHPTYGVVYYHPITPAAGTRGSSPSAPVLGRSSGPTAAGAILWPCGG